MLQTHKVDNSASLDTILQPEFRSPGRGVWIAFVRRRFSVMLLACGAAFVAAVLYLVVAVPTFTAQAQLVVDSKAAPGDTTSVSTIVESQIEIIKSEAVARAVIRKLDLAADPEFSGHGIVRGMIRWASRLLGWSRPVTSSDLTRYAMDSFKRKLTAKRVGLTYIVQLTFDSVDPDRAAQVLNAVAETYVLAEMEAKYKSALQSEKWVRDRTIELSNQAAAAKKAVADYKRRNDIANAPSASDAGALPSQSLAAKPRELSELESAAEATARTLDNFVRVQRYMEAQQQTVGTGPVLEAHLLTEASRPSGASSPKVGLVLAIAIVGGLILGGAFGILLDLADGSIRISGYESRLSLQDGGIERSGPGGIRPDPQSEASTTTRPVRLTSSV
ncbi:Wzz/FepE/Etk N-terminal domain-containing protein [Bradyrhizobium jicamae]|uniref:Wzz/FepE/Etk N-terminal domain-containing protein n=1 Tax=Bradyrhizobium jicamae TaxID=280332 RepID=UPI001BA9DFC4|nr:Wzz/FepE/Etk N-terminal domain-containing protein [Bradyrhizobium jicamae]MBR0935663.1 hypothetical protein [Bradyrhizobium jicamae]